MTRNLFTGLLACLTFPLAAAEAVIPAHRDALVSDDGWLILSATDNFAWHAKPSPLTVFKDIDGQSVWTVTIRELDKKANGVAVKKLRVTEKACAAEEGLVFVLDITGKQVNELPFALGAGNVSAQLAEGLCSLGGLSELNAEQVAELRGQMARNPDPRVRNAAGVLLHVVGHAEVAP